MNIPTKTIKDLIARFESKGIKNESDLEDMTAPFLDYSIKKYHKYAVLDFTGMLNEQFLDKIKIALEETKLISSLILAIKMESVTEVDDSAMKIIVEFKDKTILSGKTVVFLAPNEIVETYIEKHNIEKDTKIFGTQSAFEDYIFRSAFDKIK